MTREATARLTEIAERAPRLVERDSEIRTRISLLDHQRIGLRRDGQPIPSALLADRRRAREEQKALDAERARLLTELDELRAELAARQRMYRSRRAAIKRGELLSRAEFDAVVDELRREQSVLARTRNRLNDTTGHTSALSAITASSHDLMSFDSNDW